MTERWGVTEGCGVQVAARLESEARAAHGKLVAAGDALEALAQALETKEADALVQVCVCVSVCVCERERERVHGTEAAGPRPGRCSTRNCTSNRIQHQILTSYHYKHSAAHWTLNTLDSTLIPSLISNRRRWSSNPSGKCSSERPTRGTVGGTMRSMCGADAGCLAINYQSLYLKPSKPKS